MKHANGIYVLSALELEKVNGGKIMRDPDRAIERSERQRLAGAALAGAMGGVVRGAAGGPGGMAAGALIGASVGLGAYVVNAYATGGSRNAIPPTPPPPPQMMSCHGSSSGTQMQACH